MSEVSQKYLKDENGDVFSPVVSIDSIYNGTGDSLEQIINKLIDDKILADNMKKYPVGKIVLSTENINPAEYLGFGTWKAWGSGKVPVGVDTGNSNFNTVEKEGGEQSHSLTINEIPEHSHSFSATTGSNGSHQHSFSATTSRTGNHQHTGNKLESGVNSSSSSAVNDLVRPDGMSGTRCDVGNTTGNHTHTVSGNTGNTGGGQSFSIMPPYITCYMWKRIS